MFSGALFLEELSNATDRRLIYEPKKSELSGYIVSDMDKSVIGNLHLFITGKYWIHRCFRELRPSEIGDAQCNRASRL